MYKKPFFLFFGYGAEYSLGPLYTHMKAQGDTCIEIDLLKSKDVIKKIKSLIGKEVIFITSSHFLLDEKNFSYHYKNTGNIYCPLEIISILNPVCSIYYPHDLTEPIKEEEIFYLHLFDLFLSPLNNLNYLKKYIPMSYVGWIKNVKKNAESLTAHINTSKKVFFSVYQVHLNKGLDLYYKKYKSLFDLGVAVKLPYWSESEKFENYLINRGVNVYPNKMNSLEIMKENEIIYTQALSSTVLESSMLGKKIIYILDNELDYKDPKIEFKNEKNIYFAKNAIDASTINPDSIKKTESRMDYFNFTKAREEIWKTYNYKVKQ